MTLEEIKEAVMRLTDAERLELLNWMMDSFDENGAPLEPAIRETR